MSDVVVDLQSNSVIVSSAEGANVDLSEAPVVVVLELATPPIVDLAPMAEAVALDLGTLPGVVLELTAESVELASIGQPGPTGAQGTQGATGPAGPQGPPGPSGSGEGTAFRHVQGTPASVWEITHNLAYNPGGIAVRDSAGDSHEGLVEYLTVNSLRISFFTGGLPVAFSGEAYLS